jgi:hypothetical protein
MVRRLIALLAAVLVIPACGLGEFDLVDIPLPVNTGPSPGGSTPGYQPIPDTSPPEVWIGNSRTPSAVASATAFVTLEGRVVDVGSSIASMSWTNTTIGTSGIPDSHWVDTAPFGPGYVGWTADIPLLPGSNVILVSATDESGNVGTASITVTY